jgi:hypothetical protein
VKAHFEKVHNVNNRVDQKIRNGGQASGTRVTGPPHRCIIGARAGAKHATGGVGMQEGGVPAHRCLQINLRLLYWGSSHRR